jgi:hypothetical protein
MQERQFVWYHCPCTQEVLKMKRKAWLAAFVLAAMAGVGCGTDRPQEDARQPEATVPQKLNIQFTTNPSPAKVGEETELVATISRSEEPVADAKVEFEIWQGEGAHETIEAQERKNGAYSSRKTFTKPGTYQVTIHTTTKDLHQMPTMTFEVTE